MKREKNPVSTKYPQLVVPSTTSVSTLTSTAKKQLQESQQSSSALQQQQNQIISTGNKSPILSTEPSLLDTEISVRETTVDVAGSTSGTSKDPIEVLEEQVSGYNSGDEYLAQKETLISNEEWKTVRK